MILHQVAWEDQNDLVVEFVKQSEEDYELIDSDNIKRLNLRYEISKRNSLAGNRNAYPVLVSVKDFHIIERALAFSINLDKIIDPEELQIFFSKLTIIFHSGKSKEIFINKRYQMSDIEMDGEFFTEFYTAQEEDLEDFFTDSITHEEVYKEVETNVQNHQKRKRMIYKRNQTAVATNNNQKMTELLRENNKRLQDVEQALLDLTETLQNLDGFRLKELVAGNSSALPPPPSVAKSLKKPKNTSPSNKKSAGFPQRKRKSLSPKNSKMAFLGELKEVLNSSKQKSGNFNIRDILNPMSKDELANMTLNDEDLEKRKMEFITRNVVKHEQSEEQ